ncbi:MAG: hypothetical protein R3F19_30980 [Verrucomicrobiales bacterium]
MGISRWGASGNLRLVAQWEFAPGGAVGISRWGASGNLRLLAQWEGGNFARGASGNLRLVAQWEGGDFARGASGNLRLGGAVGRWEFRAGREWEFAPGGAVGKWGLVPVRPVGKCAGRHSAKVEKWELAAFRRVRAEMGEYLNMRPTAQW